MTTTFLTGAFFATVFFTATALAGAFLATTFLTATFLTATFLTTAFLTGAFFATVFLTAAFLAGAFFTAAFLTAPPTAPRLTAGPSAGSFCAPETIALNCAPGRNAGTEVGLTFTVSPVRGFRATRAARRRRSNTPKPVMVTLSPFWTARTMASTKFSTASVATRRSESIFAVRTSINSALFIQILRNSGPLWARLRITVNLYCPNIHEPRVIPAQFVAPFGGEFSNPLASLGANSLAREQPWEAGVLRLSRESKG